MEIIKGKSILNKVAIGPILYHRKTESQVKRRTVEDTEAEVKRYELAVACAEDELKTLHEKACEQVGETGAAVFEVHMMMLEDADYRDSVLNIIRNQKTNAEYAAAVTGDNFYRLFADMSDEYFRARAADVKDITNRLVKILSGDAVESGFLTQPVILMAEDLTPSVTAGINPDNVAGIVTELGGRTSHSAILSRALEIPAVVAASGILSEVKDGDELILDGESGEIFVNPGSDLIAEYEKRRDAYLQEKEELKQYIGTSSTTVDGVTVEIAANIGKPEDVDRVLAYDGEGIGLFRTEFLFMDRNEMPTEDEQFEAYKKVAVAMKGKPVIIRTLDIGGDKEIPYMGLKKDENPFLGYRAIRFCLDRKDDIYRPQLKALLRASAFGNIKIMVPMVTCIEEYREAKELVADIGKELDEAGIAYNKEIQVGIMVETAAASLMADVFAKEVDFFSIGTNDLTQYTMSVDRGNDKVSYLYSTFNPAVLRSIRHII